MSEVTDINEYRARKAKRAHCENVNKLIKLGRIQIRADLGKELRAAMNAFEDINWLPKWRQS